MQNEENASEFDEKIVQDPNDQVLLVAGRRGRGMACQGCGTTSRPVRKRVTFAAIPRISVPSESFDVCELCASEAGSAKVEDICKVEDI